MARLGGRRRGLVWALLTAAAASLALAASASAITVSGVDATPASNKAGANANVSISFDLSGGDPKDLVMKPKRKAGASRIKARFARGAVRARGKAKKPFKLIIRDADGKKTTLRVKAK